MQRAEIALTSDYAGNKPGLKGLLKEIADTGFTHYMHCHGWNSDEKYTVDQMRSINTWRREYGLELVDVHASMGGNKQVWSENPNTQDEGIDLVENRLLLTSALGGDVAVLHIPSHQGQEENFWNTVDRFVEKIEPAIRTTGVRIALENLEKRPPDLPSNFETIDRVLKSYPPNLIGLCYDSGHGNVDGNGIAKLDEIKDRLIAVHLHDNYGKTDEHNLIGEGNVEWSKLAGTIAKSSYQKPLSCESSLNDNLGVGHEERFLALAHSTLSYFSSMVEAARTK